ncbi:hypothetical protein LY474_18665 [Myxococcus stipitatus]|uniref:hypothetical protein n=1 Tax=Myxococcus stipitatus TaxID=83455 RepID=UPI001F3618A2|nr:hypothetical protein [Myxococcus stipitatus]MCE9669823.1 hypothetical protein [Myxococcus stipitatus]
MRRTSGATPPPRWPFLGMLLVAIGCAPRSHHALPEAGAATAAGGPSEPPVGACEQARGAFILESREHLACEVDDDCRAENITSLSDGCCFPMSSDWYYSRDKRVLHVETLRHCGRAVEDLPCRRGCRAACQEGRCVTVTPHLLAPMKRP